MNKILAGFLLVALCLGVRANEEIKKQVMEMGKACFDEHGVTPAEMEKLKDSNVKPEDIKDNMKCAIHCVLNKSGMMDDAGKFKPDAMKAMMNDDEKKQFDAAYNDCSSITGENPCQTAFLTFGCMHDHKQ